VQRDKHGKEKTMRRREKESVTYDRVRWPANCSTIL